MTFFIAVRASFGEAALLVFSGFLFIVGVWSFCKIKCFIPILTYFELLFLLFSYNLTFFEVRFNCAIGFKTLNLQKENRKLNYNKC